MVAKPRPTRAIRTPRDSDTFVRTAHAAACPLGPIEAQVLARMDGDTPVGDVAVLLNLSVRETAMVVARLLELGAIETLAEIDARWESREDAVTKPPPADDG